MALLSGRPTAGFVPHTDIEIATMLEFLGLESLESLFETVPKAIRLAGGLDMADGLSEFDTMAEMQRLAGANCSELICFAGAGSYDHDIPAAVRRLAGRTEFVTAYTPYQAEVAQGVLQTMFEYQTIVSRLSGLEVANASLYDGATACVEAVNLAVGATGKSGVLLSRGIHTTWRETMSTMALGTGHQLQDVSLSNGVTDWSSVSGATDVGAIVVQYPNQLGCLENVSEARALADKVGAKLVVVFDPVAAALVRSPGELGADIAVGEGQPFGTPMSLGGPYVGLFACKLENIRRVPGRIVGETVDAQGKRAYVTTLRTREQDIRREKASSNICTNQTLIAVTAAIQLAWLGTDGLRELALQSARGTRYARDLLCAIPGVEPVSSVPIVREFAIRTPVKARALVDRLADAGFLAGVPMEDDEHGLIVAVTERRTRAQIDAFASAFEKAAQ